MSEQTTAALSAALTAALAAARTAASTALAGELEQVEGEMAAALADLRPPFRQLVQAQQRDSRPLRCAAFVLAAAGADDAAPANSPPDSRKRIDLAAAIEVLRLALAVHTQLLSPPPAESAAPALLDRSLLGSTVLAGDYCFSRAAALAARTDSPVVVDIFAQALQRVSEGTLRGLFRAGKSAQSSSAGESGGFAAERELCLAGVLAAGELAGLDAAEREADRQAALLLLAEPGSPHRSDLPEDWPAPVSAARRPRWLALAEWLQRHE